MSAFELLLNATVLNPYILYKSITKKNIYISLTEHLMYYRDENVPRSNAVSTSKKPLRKHQ